MWGFCPFRRFERRGDSASYVLSAGLRGSTHTPGPVAVCNGCDYSFCNAIESFDLLETSLDGDHVVFDRLGMSLPRQSARAPASSDAARRGPRDEGRLCDERRGTTHRGSLSGQRFSSLFDFERVPFGWSRRRF